MTKRFERNKIGKEQLKQYVTSPTKNVCGREKKKIII